MKTLYTFWTGSDYTHFTFSQRFPEVREMLVHSTDDVDNTVHVFTPEYHSKPTIDEAIKILLEAT